MKRKRLILIDGNSLMYRAFYGVKQLTNSKGIHTNVIYGFVNMLSKIIEEYKPEYLGIAYDRKTPTFRHKEYEQYKAHRQKMPQEMAEQIPILKDVISAMNIKQIEIDGYEADDILGTVSKISDEQNIETLIVTGDRDAFQLISENVHIIITKKGITDIVRYDTERLLEDYKIRPNQVIDMKGLMGDASDNIPGVPGVGEKTALKLILEYDKLEKVLEQAPSFKKNKLRENLVNFSEQAVFSKKLATIMREVPIEIKFEDFELKERNNEKLIELYTELEFKAHLQKLLDDTQTQVQAFEFQLNIIELSDEQSLIDIVKAIKVKGEIVIKLLGEITALDNYLFLCDGKNQYYSVINEYNKKYFKEILEDNSIKVVGHDIKKEILFFKHMDININNIVFDTMIGAYLLNPSKNTYEPVNMYMEQVGASLQVVDQNEDYIYNNCCIVKAIAEIKDNLEQSVCKLGMKKLYYEIELPLINVLADMEYIGFKVDKSILQKLSQDFAVQLADLTESIHNDAGEEFNINSTKQLGVILFDKLNLPVIKKTKTGYSTNVDVLEALHNKHEIIDKILYYRQLLKLKSTYIDGLIGIIDSSTEKIHSKLNQAVTATGRLSSTEPNLQNIPIKTENGRQIRKVFVPSASDFTLIDADYSQIELRVLAHISEDEGMINAFKNNEDIHTRTASEVFNVSLEEVTEMMRKRAKAVNFGIVYGISDFGLSRDLKIPKKEAKTYIEKYFARYPKVKEYMNNIGQSAKDDGYVKSLLNRIRYIPEVNSKNAIQRNLGERIAMNTPIQASAADIIKIAMVKVYNELKSNTMNSRLILQVHDELIIETHKDEVEQVKKIVKKCMENAYQLSVPLVADIGEGDNWYDAK